MLLNRIADSLPTIYHLPPRCPPFCDLMIGLWCIIEGKCNVFNVSVAPGLYIHNLKRQIYNEEHLELTVKCGPLDLTLTKVRYIMISMWTLM